MLYSHTELHAQIDYNSKLNTNMIENVYFCIKHAHKCAKFIDLYFNKL